MNVLLSSSSICIWGYVVNSLKFFWRIFSCNLMLVVASFLLWIHVASYNFSICSFGYCQLEVGLLYHFQSHVCVYIYKVTERFRFNPKYIILFELNPIYNTKVNFIYKFLVLIKLSLLIAHNSDGFQSNQ